MSETLTWLAIALCLSQSAMFSGLNLAYFSVSRLRLETEVEKGNHAAIKILKLRSDSNFLLSTILWGNVSVNVLLALLSDSVMAGVVAFTFSTFGITMFGEIIPQAYFSRHSLRAGALLSPIIRFYQYLLYPFAKPSALLLDKWVGPEGTLFWREEDFEVLLNRHIREPETEISSAEGRGAINFLHLDDLHIAGEGKALDLETVIAVEMDANDPGGPILPRPGSPEAAALVQQIQKTDHTWMIFTSPDGEPVLALNSSDFLRHHYSGHTEADPSRYCHKPVVVKDPQTPLDEILPKLIVEAEHADDRLVDREVVLYWGDDAKRIMTGPDILGRLLHGIVRRSGPEPKPQTHLDQKNK